MTMCLTTATQVAGTRRPARQLTLSPPCGTCHQVLSLASGTSCRSRVMSYHVMPYPALSCPVRRPSVRFFLECGNFWLPAFARKGMIDGTWHLILALKERNSMPPTLRDLFQGEPFPHSSSTVVIPLGGGLKALKFTFPTFAGGGGMGLHPENPAAAATVCSERGTISTYLSTSSF